MKLLSAGYREQLRIKHGVNPWGGRGADWIPELVRTMLRYPPARPSAISVLDFGCGRHTFRDGMKWLMPQVQVVEYDPGQPGIDELPAGPFDYVVCTDVMEHVEEEFVRDTLGAIAARARHAAVFNIACCESSSRLPDGRDTHITIRSHQWWLEQVHGFFIDIHRMEAPARHIAFSAVPHA